MSTGKIIGYIVAGILLFFGVLWLLSAFSSETLNPGGRLLVGGILVLLGMGIIVAVRKQNHYTGLGLDILKTVCRSRDCRTDCSAVAGHSYMHTFQKAHQYAVINSQRALGKSITCEHHHSDTVAFTFFDKFRHNILDRIKPCYTLAIKREIHGLHAS